MFQICSRFRLYLLAGGLAVFSGPGSRVFPGGRLTQGIELQPDDLDMFFQYEQLVIKGDGRADMADVAVDPIEAGKVGFDIGDRPFFQDLPLQLPQLTIKGIVP